MDMICYNAPSFPALSSTLTSLPYPPPPPPPHTLHIQGLPLPAALQQDAAGGRQRSDACDGAAGWPAGA
eukprot:365369-Chlamydomonas_euryale.AAC.6